MTVIHFVWFFLDELYLGLVATDVACGDIVSVDWSAALACPGVVDKVDHTDIKNNMDGIYFIDEEIFVSKRV